VLVILKVVAVLRIHASCEVPCHLLGWCLLVLGRVSELRLSLGSLGGALLRTPLLLVQHYTSIICWSLLFFCVGIVFSFSVVSVRTLLSPFLLGAHPCLSTILRAGFIFLLGDAGTRILADALLQLDHILIRDCDRPLN